MADRQNLIVNGSFEDTTGTHPEGFGRQSDSSSITGWTATDASMQFEFVNAGINVGNEPTDGLYVMDMEQSPGNLHMYQDVAGLSAGEEYRLSFDAGDTTRSRQNTLEVYWNSALIDTVDPVVGGMEGFSYSLIGGSGDGSDRLEFRGLGPVNGYGVQLDNIKLIESEDAMTTPQLDFTLTEPLVGESYFGWGGVAPITTGDLNDDGFADIVYTHWGWNVGVFLSNGDGSFADEQLLSEPWWLTGQRSSSDYIGSTGTTLGDLDSDGTLDMAISIYGPHYSGRMVQLYRSLGDGTFEPWAVDGYDAVNDIQGLNRDGVDDGVILTSGTNPMFTLIGDFNGDGLNDVASCSNNGSWSVDIITQNAAGDFAVVDVNRAGRNPQYLAQADFNEDGSVDIAAGSLDRVRVFLNDADGTGNMTLQETLFKSYDGNEQIIAADVDGDGHADIISRNQKAAYLTVLYGDGMGAFPTQTRYDTSGFGGYLGAADMDGDGDIDLVAASRSTGSVDVLLNDGGRTFAAPHSIDVGAAPTGISLDDLDNNGRIDIVTSLEDYTVQVLWNTSSASNEVDGTPGDDTIDGSYVDVDGDRIDSGLGIGPDGNGDLVLAGDGDDSVDAGLGDDTVFGGAGDDTLGDFWGNDVLDGGSGDDYMRGGFGNDTLLGDLGNDTLYGEARNDVLNGGAGNDVLYGGQGNDMLRGGAGDDLLVADDTYHRGGADTLAGNDGNDTLRGGSGVDRLFGGAGDDLIEGGNGADMMRGGLGGDVMNGGNGLDLIFGDYGADSLDGGSGQDTLIGGDDNDTLNGDMHDDALHGGAGNDLMDGGKDDDTLFGGSGDDTLDGGTGADALFGDSGDDSILGGTADDTIEGGSGADVIDGGSNADLIAGQNGNDTLLGGSGHDTLWGGADDDTMSASSGHDSLNGGSGNDRMFGGINNDTLEGTLGDDYLSGGSNDDLLRGGSDNDTLIGGAGQDTLTGGPGADSFVFTAASDSPHGPSRDVITDFSHGEDVIDLSGLGAGLTFVASYSGAAGEVFYNASIGALYADLDGDGAWDFSVDLSSATTLDAGDLIL